MHLLNTQVFICVLIVAAACLLQVFPANTNGNNLAVIILPVPIEAVAVRVSPNDWENSIALKLEFYGCNLICPFTPGKENVSVPLSCHYPHLLIIIIIIIVSNKILRFDWFVALVYSLILLMQCQLSTVQFDLSLQKLLVLRHVKSES